MEEGSSQRPFPIILHHGMGDAPVLVVEAAVGTWLPGEGLGTVGQVRVPCTVSWIKPRSSPYELMAWQLKNTESPRSAGLSWEVASGGRGWGEREEMGRVF